MTTPQWETVTTAIPRDRWNRPLVIPPGGKPGDKLIPLTRCTTFIDVLDDTYQLQRWKQRVTAVGLSLRHDLLLRASSLGPQPDKIEEEEQYKKWRGEMDKLCEQAMEAGEASAAATIGTALHAFTDRIDRGEQLNYRKIPGQYAKHLKAYQVATEHLTAVHIETFVVQDDLQIGGTPDRISMVDGQDGLYICDTKSGDKLEYGMGKIAMQMAVYAHSRIYNPATGERTPIPGINQDEGIVIALNAARGTCELVSVDLRAGWEGVQLAAEVRAWRKRKGMSRPYKEHIPTLLTPEPDWTPPPTPPKEVDAHDELAIFRDLTRAATTEELVAIWQRNEAVWTPAMTERAAARKAQLTTQ
jgi:hypothetical protein